MWSQLSQLHSQILDSFGKNYSIMTFSPIFRYPLCISHNCHKILTFMIGAVTVDQICHNCGWSCDNRGFLWQLWVALQQLWLIETTMASHLSAYCVLVDSALVKGIWGQQSCKRFRNRNHIPESESELKPGLLELELETESFATGIGIGIGIIDYGKPWNGNRNQPSWNRNLNRNHWYWNDLQLWRTGHLLYIHINKCLDSHKRNIDLNFSCWVPFSVLWNEPQLAPNS